VNPSITAVEAIRSERAGFGGAGSAGDTGVGAEMIQDIRHDSALHAELERRAPELRLTGIANH